MDMNGIHQFFEKINADDKNIELIKPFFNLLDAFSKVMRQSIYVVDYYKRGFVYVSSNPLFLCGYKTQEVLKMGYSFYKKVVVEEDLKLLYEIDKIGYDLFHQLPINDRMKSMISYDYRLKQPGGRTIMVNQKCTPVFLTEEGNVQFALCVLGLSTHSNPGNVMVKVDDVLNNYVYSFKSKKWDVISKIKITNRERDILQLAAQGYSNEEIANILFINVSTVKFHKSNIFSKFNVKNTTSAIVFAYNNKLL